MTVSTPRRSSAPITAEPPPDGVRRPRRVEVRADLLAAARDSFERDGYARSTLADVAARAGYTKGAVYSNFAGKPELFAEACQAHFEESSDSVVEALDQYLALPSGSRGTAHLVDSLVSTLAGSPWPLLLDEFRHVARRDPAVAAVYTELRGRRTARVCALLAEHGVGEDEAHREDLAVILLAQLNELALDASVGHASPTGRPESTRVLGRLVDGLLP